MIAKPCKKCKTTDRTKGGRCRLCLRVYNAKRYANNPTDRKERDLKRKYGLTIIQYEELKIKQNNRCAICARPPSRANFREMVLHVDHDHETGKVRGLLCAKCNRLVGLAYNKSEILTKASDYLKKTSP